VRRRTDAHGKALTRCASGTSSFLFFFTKDMWRNMSIVLKMLRWKMRVIRFVLLGTVVLYVSFYVGQAFADVLPPHEPGSICMTHQRFWCWASPPGRAGQPCICSTPYGRVEGELT
jgi:hypothetical protein